MAGTIISLVFFIISVVFAVINNELRSAGIWAWWAIWAAVFLEGHYVLP